MKLKKSLGQHFLRDKKIVKRIVDTGNITPEDRIVEIGPGGGALTEEILSRKPKELVLIEIDPQWVEYLKNRFGSSVKIFNADAKEFNFSLLKGKWKFFGNLPYNVSTSIIRNLLRHREIFDSGVFMVQKEVANRLSSKKGKDFGYLPALLQPFFRIERVFDVHPMAFNPPPKVWSTVFKMVPTGFNMNEDDLLSFEKFLKRIFSHRRKKIKKNLGIKEFPPELKEFADKRAEEIPAEKLLLLFKSLKSYNKLS